MIRRVVLWIGVVCSAGTVSAQSAAIPRPPGGDSYFGAAAGQAFAPDAIFSAAPAPTAPAPAADGGLLPPKPAPPLWSGSADLGVNGTTGNSELFNLRFNTLARRKSKGNDFTTDFLYQLARQDGLTTARQALWNARDEVLFAGTPWSLFGALNLEYDRLREYDFRVGVYSGVGYTVIDDSDRTFKLRAGAGAVREFVTSNSLIVAANPTAPRPGDRWVPEFVFGYDFRYRLTERSSFLSVLDYYPRVDDFSQYRVRVRAAYENLLDPEMGLILRLGVQDRYDSDPGRAKRNDLSYFSTVGVKF